MTRRKTKDEAIDSRGQNPVGRGELIAIAAVVLLAGALRIGYPSRLAVEHFDEGVYASNIWFGEASDYRYPARHLYAPPLLPALIEWSIILFGVGPISVKLVSLLAGTATVGVVWWVGRRWFGREAGMAAAVLAALSDVHIVYSRMALTDVLMCLWLLIAVGCVHEMLVRGRQGWAVAAGLATGLAWATKYNGWLPVAIAVSGFVFYALVAWWKSSERRVTWRGFGVSMLLMVVTTAVVWSPVWFDLQDRGGYAAVAENHRGYLVGWDGWFGSLTRQIGNHRYLEGALNWMAVGLAVVGAVGVTGWAGASSTWKPSENFAKSDAKARPSTTDTHRWAFATGLGMLLILSAWIFGASVILGALAVVAVVKHLTGRRDAEESTMGVCLLSVWFVGLLLATPLYFPYPRLTLPWLVAVWLGGGAMIGRIVRSAKPLQTGEAETSFSPRRMSLLVGMIIASCYAMAGAAVFLFTIDSSLDTAIARFSQDGLKEIAAEVVEDVRDSDPQFDGGETVLDVYAEPGLFYELSAAVREDSELIIVPIGSLNSLAGAPNQRSFLLTGPNAHREAEYLEVISRLGDRLELISEYEYQPSAVVLLNWHPPRDLESTERSQYRVRLYRIR